MKSVWVCVSAFVLLGAGTSQAQGAPEVVFNAGVVSDYVFRGLSQTDGRVAVQGGIDADLGGLYMGAWASNVDFGDGSDAEVDLYGGYRTQAAGYDLDFGVAGYGYVSAPDEADYNYVEFMAQISRPIGAAVLGAAAYYSFDYSGADKKATYVELNAAYQPAEKWTLSAMVGHQWLDVSGDYTTWNLGTAYALSDALALDVRYHGVDSPQSDNRMTVGLTANF